VRLWWWWTVGASIYSIVRYVADFSAFCSLGPSQHTQHALIPLPDIKHAIESVALGQDHTLALTSTGEVLTWGLNRFSQLGYVIEVSSSAKQDEHIQATPRKVGSLRRESVKGVAACKTASGCWTDTEVWTWGTNGGQLGGLFSPGLLMLAHVEIH
jgi:alpha-tubulin suppressor-like RCC1 family protein